MSTAVETSRLRGQRLLNLHYGNIGRQDFKRGILNLNQPTVKSRVLTRLVYKHMYAFSDCLCTVTF